MKRMYSHHTSNQASPVNLVQGYITCETNIYILFHVRALWQNGLLQWTLQGGCEDTRLIAVYGGWGDGLVNGHQSPVERRAQWRGLLFTGLPVGAWQRSGCVCGHKLFQGPLESLKRHHGDLLNLSLTTVFNLLEHVKTFFYENDPEKDACR